MSGIAPAARSYADFTALGVAASVVDVDDVDDDSCTNPDTEVVPEGIVAFDAAVILPFASTVNVATCVALPYDAGDTAVLANVSVVVPAVLVASPVNAGRRAAGTVPVNKFVAFSDHCLFAASKAPVGSETLIILLLLTSNPSRVTNLVFVAILIP